MGIQRFTDLKVWQEAHQITLSVYGLSRSYPKEEKFGLTLQIRRAAVSIPANIAEGFGRRHLKDRARFLEIAKASAEEVRYHLILSRDLGYIAGDSGLDRRLDGVCAMLHSARESVLGP